MEQKKAKKGTAPPRYLVFFKGRDVDVLTQAFKEFSAKTVKQKDKPSLRKILSRNMEQSSYRGGAELFFAFFGSICFCPFPFQFTTLFPVCQFGYGGSPYVNEDEDKEPDIADDDEDEEDEEDSSDE